MFDFSGTQIEIYCSQCHKAMGLVSKEEFKACTWKGGVWAEKCFDCADDLHSEFSMNFFLGLVAGDYVVVGDLMFEVGVGLRFVCVGGSHAHARARARGLSSSTYLNKSGGDKPKGFVEQSGKRWIETEKTMCKRCNGRGLVFPIDEPMAGCSLCEGSGVLYRDIEYPVFLDIPEWVLQPKFQLSGVRLEDEHLFADWLVDDDDDEKDGGYAAYQDFKRDRFGVGDNE